MFTLKIKLGANSVEITAETKEEAFNSFNEVKDYLNINSQEKPREGYQPRQSKQMTEVPRLASSKQIEYLKELGADDLPEGLSSAEASRMITRLKSGQTIPAPKKSEKNWPPKNKPGTPARIIEADSDDDPDLHEIFGD